MMYLHLGEGEHIHIAKLHVVSIGTEKRSLGDPTTRILTTAGVCYYVTESAQEVAGLMDELPRPFDPTRLQS